MNRRDLLKSVIGLGGVAILPFPSQASITTILEKDFKEKKVQDTLDMFSSFESFSSYITSKRVIKGDVANHVVRGAFDLTENRELIFRSLQRKYDPTITVVIKGRMVGMSTFYRAHALYEALKECDQHVIVICHTYDSAKISAKETKDMFLSMTFPNIHQMTECTKDRIKFNNGSSIIFRSANLRAFHSEHATYVIFDEADFYREDFGELFNEALLAAPNKILIHTTPNNSNSTKFQTWLKNNNDVSIEKFRITRL